MTVQVKDGEYIEVVINDVIFAEEDFCKQTRICRVTGIVEECLVNKSDAIRYLELIKSSWYKEVFGRANGSVHIRNLKIDLIPDNRIKAVYRSYLYHYDFDSFSNLNNISPNEARIALRDLKEKYKYTIVNCVDKKDISEPTLENHDTIEKQCILVRIIKRFFRKNIHSGVFEWLTN